MLDLLPVSHRREIFFIVIEDRFVDESVLAFGIVRRQVDEGAFSSERDDFV
jgi:hypothetical protein